MWSTMGSLQSSETSRLIVEAAAWWNDGACAETNSATLTASGFQGASTLTPFQPSQRHES